MPAVTVVIPSWNGKDLLRSICLPSLVAQSFRDFSIIVVDNGSTDGTAAYLTSEWPAVDVLELLLNSGFAAAVNRGIAAAESEFVVLLNNDVELDCRWLEEMVSAARKLPEAGSFACRMMDFEDRELVTAAGDCVSTGGRIFPRGWRMRNVGQFDQVAPVLSASAGAALYRREALEIVGPFDEDFFAYFEDVDWGFRAQLAGFSCWYVPSAVAYHIGGATSSQVSGLRRALLARNAYWLVLKNFPVSLAVRNGPSLVFVLARGFYRTGREGDPKQAVTAIVQALGLTPAMLRKRHQIQSSRRLGDDDLVRILSRDISLGSRQLERLQSLLMRWRSPQPRSPD